MIPRKIHYCWLSGEAMPAQMRKCVASWREKMPAYELVLWDRERVEKIEGEGREWIRFWMARKNYAFAADYVRLWALWSEGGLYLDTDVEVLKSFDDLLDRPLLIGEESGTGEIEAAVLGAEAGNRKIQRVLESFGLKPCRDVERVEGETLPKRMRRVLGDEVEVLSSEYLSPKSWRTGRLAVTKRTYCIHHFAGSWLSQKERLAQLAGQQLGSWAIPCVRWIFNRVVGNRDRGVRGSMKIFVINRRQDMARWEKISAQLEALGLEYERVEACDGRSLSAAAKREIADYPKMRRVLRVLSDGEIGCAASHLSVYRRMVSEDIEVACVLEDDAKILGCFAETLRNGGTKVVGSASRGWVRLLTDRKHGMIWTVGYVINRVGAEEMLRYNVPIWRVADCWESLVRRGRLGLDWCADVCVEPDRSLGSVITPEGVPPHRVPLPDDLWSTVKRTLWRLAYGIGVRV